VPKAAWQRHGHGGNGGNNPQLGEDVRHTAVVALDAGDGISPRRYWERS
jgi:hypothetical protein